MNILREPMLCFSTGTLKNDSFLEKFLLSVSLSLSVNIKIGLL